MNKKFYVFLLVAVLIFLNGCVAYYPQVVDIPLIKHKGDLRVNAGTFLVPDFQSRENIRVDENDNEGPEWLGNVGLHGTVSYGLTDVLSIQGYTSVDVSFRYHLQAALGAYQAFDNNTVMEIYGGFGYGNGFYNSQFHIRDGYYLPFAQFNIGRTGIGTKCIDYGLGLKGGYIFSNFDNSIGQDVIHQTNGWMFEPSVFFRFGVRRVKFNTTVNYLWTKTVDDLYYFPLNVGLSVNLHLGKMK